jgi:hypothetical protein
MIKLEADNSISFAEQDMREIYDPIVSQYGFEYDEYLTKITHDISWSKLYEGEPCAETVWPIMVITRSAGDFTDVPAEGSFFSTRLYWDPSLSNDGGLFIFSNPREWGDEHAGEENDEVAQLIYHAQAAQKEVNQVLEECRKQLVTRLNEIRAELITKNS